MDKTVLAVRAITSEYAKRWLWLPFAIGTFGYLFIMIIIGWVAAVADPWWWLLGIIPTILFLIALTIWIASRLIIARVAPVTNSAQRKAARRFIDRIDKVAEHAATPKFVIMYRILKDVIIRPTSSKTYIGEIAQEPGEMRRAFDDLRSLF